MRAAAVAIVFAVISASARMSCQGGWWMSTACGGFAVPWQAKLLRLAAGVLPGAVSDVLGAVDRLLPEPGGIGSRAIPGHEATTLVTRSPLAALMHRAARRNNEIVSPAAAV